MGVKLHENWGANWILASAVRNSGISRTDAPPGVLDLPPGTSVKKVALFGCERIEGLR